MPDPTASRPRLHVLQILEATTGGTRRHMVDLISHLPADRFRVSLACSTRRDPRFLDDLADMKARGVTVHIVPMRREIRPFSDLAAFVQLRRIIRRGGFDVVHTHSSKAGFLGRLAAASAGVPRIIHTPHTFPFQMDVHGFRRSGYVQLERLAARFTDRLICVCPAQKILAQSVIDPARIAVVENGIALRPPRDPAERQRHRLAWGVAPDQPLVGVVGRFVPQKGYADVVAAAGLVAELRPDARFALVGDGELKTDIEGRIRSRGLQSRVVIVEGREDAPELMPAFDIVALPSLWEGLPYVLLEAMAAGRAVVATRVGGIPDVIDDGRDGVLVPAREPAALAAAIAKLIDNGERRSMMGVEARDKVVARYGLDRMISRIVALYEGTL